MKTSYSNLLFAGLMTGCSPPAAAPVATPLVPASPAEKSHIWSMGAYPKNGL